MKIQLYLIITCIILSFFKITKCSNSNEFNDMPINYTLKLYDDNYIEKETYSLTYNYTTFLFNEFEEIKK
eukprot:jgi/Orpsp1_1/1174043/evm.model.c7180000048678.1